MRGSFARVGHGSNDPYSTCANASYHLQDGGVLLSVGGDVFFDPNQPSRFIVP